VIKTSGTKLMKLWYNLIKGEQGLIYEKLEQGFKTS